MIRRTLVALARRVKRDAAFDVADEIPSGALVSFVLNRAAMVSRGVLVSLRTGNWTFPVFVGRRVTITNPRHLHLEPGVTIDDYCRLDCLGATGIVLNRGVTLRRGVQIEVTSVLRDLGVGCVLGERVGVSEGSYIGAKGPVNIGRNTIIGPGVKIIAENHVIASTEVPIREQGVTRSGIDIGTDCWLGAGCIVVDGVCIGDGSVVGAGAVVTRSIEGGMVAVGVPAHPLRPRRGSTT